jgi:hypothetical protein
MSTFLNIDLEGKINTNFIFKHLFFCFFWLNGILLFIFRLDILVIEKYPELLDWSVISIPLIYLILLAIYFFFIKWYYIIVFILYPFLMIFWFIPKTILSVGKVYIFGNYINTIFSTLSNIKLFIFNISFFSITFSLLFMVGSNLTRWLAVVCFSYFYLIYIYKFLKKSFQKPTLFGAKIEESIRALINNTSFENSLIIKSYIIQQDDQKLEELVRKEKQIRRTLIANSAINLLSDRLNSCQGRKAYLVSWCFGAIIFLIYSIIFFWFLNFQLFKINPLNFSYNGTLPSFDFFYYTLKTITFGDIELVKPLSLLSRISEITSFFTIGIFTLVIVISVFLSMKQDKVNENVVLTTQLFASENSTIIQFFKKEFGMEINTAYNEIHNIDSSLKKLKDIIDKIF